MQLRATRLTCIAHAARRAVAPAAYTPALLFASGEQGAWYDPSDPTTLFQDAAGTVPVTAVEQPVGRMLDKSGRGNHATQSTAINRPVLSARVNRLLGTEDLTGVNWVKESSGTGNAPVVTSGFEAPDGTLTAFRLQLNKGVGASSADLSLLKAQSFALSALTKTSSIWIKSLSGTPSIVFRNSGARNDLITISTEWVLYSLANITVSATEDIFQIILRGSFNTSNSCDLLLWHPDDRASNDGVGLPAYQRVNTATDYDTAGFPLYLRFNGTNSWMQTASIDFTGTDKMTAWAGVRKFTAQGTLSFLYELSSSSEVSGGMFQQSAPGGFSQYGFGSKGTVLATATTIESIFAAPVTSVLTSIGNISGDQSILRINGTQAAINTTDQGTGNYGNYPLFIGARAGNQFWFNGRLYPLIIRGAQSTAEQIAQTETWVNGKTRAYA